MALDTSWRIQSERQEESGMHENQLWFSRHLRTLKRSLFALKASSTAPSSSSCRANKRSSFDVAKPASALVIRQRERHHKVKEARSSIYFWSRRLDTWNELPRHALRLHASRKSFFFVFVNLSRVAFQCCNARSYTVHSSEKYFYNALPLLLVPFRVLCSLPFRAVCFVHAKPRLIKPT